MEHFTKQTIDKNTPVPMYYQLKKIILDMMKSGRLKPGNMLPTELELSDMFGISRTTTRQAIMELVAEGQLYRIKSKGTFIAEKKVVQDFTNVIRASHNLLKTQNVTTTTKVLECAVVTADELTAKMLQINAGDQIIRLYRLRYVDEEPNVLAEAYLPMFCKHILELDMNKIGLYQFLDMKKETTPARAVRHLEAITASEEDAQLLNINNGAAIQLTTSVTYTKEGLPLEYSVAKFRGDRNVFKCDVTI